MGSCLSCIQPVVTSDQTSTACVRNSSGGFRNAYKDASDPGCDIEASCQTENFPGITETAKDDKTGSPLTIMNAIENRMHPPLPHESSEKASGLAGSNASSETPPGPHHDFESNR